MITSIAIENFKGIRERMQIDIRPITLLFGANSSGKSTVLHALQYAREIFERHNLDADETTAGGSYIDLGGYENLVHGRDRSHPLKIRIDLELDWQGLPSFDADFEIMGRIVEGRVDSFVKKGLKTAAVEITIQWSSLENCPYVSATVIFLDGKKFARITAQPNLRGVVLTDLALNHPSLLTLEDVSASQDGERSIFDFESVLGVVLPHCAEWLPPGGGHSIQLSGQHDSLPRLDERLTIDVEPYTESGDAETDRAKAEQVILAREYVTALSDLIVGPCQLIRDHLCELRYLGPLRETPPRNYQPPRFADPSRWSSGLGAWDLLQTGPEDLVDRVGDWLGDKDKLNSGYRVERRSYKELDLGHPLVVKLLTGRAFDEAETDSNIDLNAIPTQSRIVVIPDGTELELRPHDVGIGISQVVPVVTTALDDQLRILAIEQPELHLHPKLQAELADLFIEAACGDSQHTVILETHSELIPLRIMRRIRESQTAPDGNGDRPFITSKDVAIVYIESYNGSTIVTPLELGSDGRLLDPWPDGFFEEGFRERFTD